MAMFSGFILIGGKSSRMGADKFSLMLRGKTLLEIATETLQSFGEVSAVISEFSDFQYRLPTIKDIYRNRGALSGIHAALVHAKSEWTIILACDYPFVTAELIEFMQNTAKLEKKFDAFAPIQADGRIQPLCAIYKTDICRKVLSKMLDNSNESHSIRDFLGLVKTRYIEFPEIEHLPNSKHFFLNVNTPEDFDFAVELSESGTEQTEVEILKMTPNDVEKIVEIQSACDLEGWTAEDYRREINRTDSFNVTALMNGEPIGYLVGRLVQAERCAELYNIGVDPRFRRKEIGNEMLAEFTAFCETENIGKIFLEVRESNKSAIKFYLKNDFVVIGKRKSFYSNPTENAILMAKLLSSTK